MKYIFFFILVWCCNLAWSQTINISEQLTLRNEISYEIIGSFSGNTLLFRNKSISFEIDAFNSSLKKIWTKEIALEKRQPQVISLAKTNADFSVYYHHKSPEGTVLKGHKYNGRAELIDTVTLKVFDNLFYNTDFRFVQSEDKNIQLFYFLEKQNQFYFIAVDNRDMSVLWEQVIAIEEFSKNRDFYQILIDNKGMVFVNVELDNFRLKKSSHVFQFYKFDYTNGDFLKAEVLFEDILTSDVQFVLDNLNGNLLGAGFYSENSSNRSQGFFTIHIPKAFQTKPKAAFQSFSPEFQINLMGDKNDGEKGIFDCKIAEIAMKENGGMLIIGERFSEIERRISNAGRFGGGGMNRLIIDYFYDDLFILSLDRNATLEWSQIFHKKQYSQDDGAAYSSYFLYKTPERLRFLFNDDIKMENTISEYVLSGYGDFDRNSILSTENLKLRLRFRDAVQIAYDKIIIPSERRNELKLVRMNY
jgi:hypothetical protein